MELTSFRISRTNKEFLEKNNIKMGPKINDLLDEYRMNYADEIETLILKKEREIKALKATLKDLDVVDEITTNVNGAKVDIDGLKDLIQKALTIKRTSNQMDNWIKEKHKDIEALGGTVKMFRKMIRSAYQKAYGEPLW
jgi:hypothetical protein